MAVEKRAAMLVKMEAAAGAAAASAMSPDSAAAAIETITHTITTTSTSSSSSSSPAAEVSRRLTALVSQMEPFAAAQATSAMSEEMATAVQAALPPERSAAIIASGGLDSQRVGRMLDALPTEAADKVMAALPPNVAEKTSQHVSSGEIKARAAARAVVHLSSSTVTGRGKTSCVAGEPAKFSLESANPGGGRITRGGAHVNCTVYLLGPDPATHNPGVNSQSDARVAKRQRISTGLEGDVTDLQNGVYSVTYTATRSGAHEVVLTTAGQEHSLQVTCIAAELDPAHCLVEQPDLVAKPWLAGDTLQVRVNCRDRFGNAVQPPSPDNQAAALAIVVGPATYCPPRHRHAFEPSFLESNDSL